MTLTEWERLPNDGNRYELIDGVLYVSAAPRNLHQITLTSLFEYLAPYVRRRKLGRVYVAPFDVFMDPASQTCVEPDMLFVAASRLPIIRDRGVYGAPDLVIEILSESTWRVDLGDKRELYQRCGVQEYWAVDTDTKEILVYRFAESAEPARLGAAGTLSTPLLPGLDIPLRDILES